MFDDRTRELMAQINLPSYEDKVKVSPRVREVAGQVIHLLRENHPIHSPIVAPDLCEILHINQVTLRKAVGHVRTWSCGDPQPIASGGSGYFWARSRFELENTIGHLTGRFLILGDEIKGLESLFPGQQNLEI